MHMNQPTRTVRQTYSVANIQFQASVDTLKQRVSSLRGIISCEVSAASGILTVEYDTESISSADIIQEIQSCGYTVYNQKEEPDSVSPQPKKLVSNKIPLLTITCSCAIALTYFLSFPQWLGLLLAFLSFISSYSILKKAFLSFWGRKNSGNLLSIITAILSAIIGTILLLRNQNDCLLFYFAASVILSSCAVAEIITSYDQRKQTLTTDVQKSLPKEAVVFQGRTEHRIHVSDIKKDQIIFIRPGEMIPIDGKVINGFALVDASAITGNDTPIEKSKGAYVYANSKCMKGSIEVKAVNLGDSTAMMQLAKMAEATANDPSYSSPFQKFSLWLSFYILITAVISFIGWQFTGSTATSALFTAITVLSCGSVSSLKINSEKNVLTAARNAAKNHIFFRSVKSLELLSQTDILFIDQEGVLTDPNLIVTDFMPLNGTTSGRLEYIAYALESKKNNSFAKAITRYLRTRKMSSVNKQEFYHFSSVGRDEFSVINHCDSGNIEVMEEKGTDVSSYHSEIDKLSKQGKQLLFFSENKKIIGIVAAIHEVIPGAETALRQLEEKDIHIHVFNNSNEAEAENLKKAFNLTSMIQASTDKEKEHYMNRECDKDSVVTYISSHPSVSNNNVDIHVLIDSDIKLHIKDTDIVLVRNQLSDLVKAINISSSTYEQIQRSQFNIIMYHIAVILLFAFILPRFLSPWVTIILSTVSSLICLLLAITHPIKQNSEI